MPTELVLIVIEILHYDFDKKVNMRLNYRYMSMLLHNKIPQA